MTREEIEATRLVELHYKIDENEKSVYNQMTYDMAIRGALITVDCILKIDFMKSGEEENYTNHFYSGVKRILEDRLK